LLIPQPLIFSAQPFQFRLVLVDLPLLIILPPILGHKLIANQCASDEPYRSADECADCGVSHGTADDSARAGADTSTDEPSLFTLRKWLRTARADNQARRLKKQSPKDKSFSDSC